MGEADSGTDWFPCRQMGRDSCWQRVETLGMSSAGVGRWGVGVRKEAWGLGLGLLGPGMR